MGVGVRTRAESSQDFGVVVPSKHRPGNVTSPELLAIEQKARTEGKDISEWARGKLVKAAS